jgi:glycosyltransferase involved in cell wall biosynthesis
MCDAINSQIAASPLRHYQDGRLVSLGYVDNIALDAIIANASALLLPIEYGGGSHLKTAEALASGRPIIGTSSSFRGFTEYLDLSRVTIADTPEQFEAEIHNSLCTPETRLGDIPMPREVLWEATLDPLVQLLRSMAV